MRPDGLRHRRGLRPRGMHRPRARGRRNRGGARTRPHRRITSASRLVEQEGTDGFGRSDTRPTLRRHFRVDAESIIVAALAQLAAGSSIGWDAVVQAALRYRLDDDAYFPHRADCRGEA